MASILRDEDRPGERDLDLELSEESPVGSGFLLALLSGGFKVGFPLIFSVIWVANDMYRNTTKVTSTANGELMDGNYVFV